MVRIGMIGLGMMGRTHFEAYRRMDSAKVTAVADADPRRAAGDLRGTEGNILRGEIDRLPLEGIFATADWRQLLVRDDVDVIDICVPTPQHVELALAALAAGKHVVCEKPMARTSADARRIAEAARAARGLFMPAMCMRFWPGWTWLKQAVAGQRYGRVLAATFRRLASMPAGWYADGRLSGGALLDLHIHDTDFVYWLFGRPKSVSSRGYSCSSGEIDHISTQYAYDDIPLVTAEGAWCMAPGFPFSMHYLVHFERATAEFDLPRGLTVYSDGRAEAVPLEAGTGYDGELRHFVDCVAAGSRPAVTADDAATAIEILEAEARSLRRGQPENC